MDNTWFANCDMHEAACWIEKRYVGNSGKLPLVTNFSRPAIDFNQHALIARDVELPPLVIDINSVRPRCRKEPMLHFVQIGQPRNEYHGRFADREEHTSAANVGHAPAWLPRENE